MKKTFFMMIIIIVVIKFNGYSSIVKAYIDTMGNTTAHFCCDTVIVYKASASWSGIQWKHSNVVISTADSVIITHSMFGGWTFISIQTGTIYFAIYFDSPVVHSTKMPDSVVCTMNPYIPLDAENPGGTNYLWNTGLTSSAFYATSIDTFWCHIWNTCNSIIDTAIISYYNANAPVLNVGDTVNLPTGSSTQVLSVIPGSPSYSTYHWSWGASSSSSASTVTLGPVGWVILYVSDGICNGMDSTFIHFTTGISTYETDQITHYELYTILGQYISSSKEPKFNAPYGVYIMRAYNQKNNLIYSKKLPIGNQ